LIWGAYGAAYVVVFLARGRPLPAVLAAVLVVSIGVGLAIEVRRPVATQPRLLGWEQDERQRLIHQQSMALVGHVAVAGLFVSGFIAFVADSDIIEWLMPAVGGAVLVYGIGLAVYQRRA